MLAGSLANPWKVRLVLTWSRNLRIPMPTLDRISNYVTTTRVTQKNWDVNTSEAATRVVLYKKVFFEISQKSQKNTCARVSFLLKKRLWHRCFPMNFAKFPRATFFQNTSGRLLLCFVWVDYARWKKRYEFNGCTNRGLCIAIRAYHWLYQQEIMHNNLCIPNGFTNRLGITIRAYLMAAPTRDYAYGNDNSKVTVILKINDVWVTKAWELKIHL